jgi:hypothetical protein
MRLFLLLALTALTGCATMGAHRAPRDDGAGGGLQRLPPLQLEIFNQATPPSGSASSGPTLAADQTWVGANTFNAAISSTVASGAAVSLTAGGKVCLNGACTSYIYAPSGTDVQSASRFTILGVNADDYFSGTTAAVKIKGGIANGASAIGVKIGNLSTLTTDGAVIAGFYNDTSFANLKWSVRSDGATQFVGVANASLPACDAAHEGSVNYDTTNHKHVGCNGTAWTNLY